MATSNSKAESVGRWLGKAWRNIARHELGVAHWMIAQGMSPIVVSAVLWVVKLVALCILLYVAFWPALLVALTVVVARIANVTASQDVAVRWKIGEQADHRQSVFYDPINYNDPPDPRFDDK
jgi:hypothetical protein